MGDDGLKLHSVIRSRPTSVVVAALIVSATFSAATAGAAAASVATGHRMPHGGVVSRAPATGAPQSSSDVQDPRPKLSTAFTAWANQVPATYGRTETLHENLLVAAGRGTPPTGSVIFSANGSTLCTTTLPATSCTTRASLAPGTYIVVATYSGDSAHEASKAATAFTVGEAPTSFTASASPNPATYPSDITLSESGLVAAGGGVAPTGSVTFSAAGSTLCTTILPTTSCATGTAPVPGTYGVTATYSGDSNYAGSTATTSFTVDKATTSFTASASPTPASYGNEETLSESGLVAADGAPAPTGTVTFTANSSTLCVATLPSTSCATATPPVTGTYTVTATYSGDGDYAGSTATTSFTVNWAGTSFVAGASASTGSYGVDVGLWEQGLVAKGGGVAPTGTVTFTANSSTLCTVTLPDPFCWMSTAPGAGSYNVTATYSGDSNYQGSTATTSFTIDKARTSFSASANPTSTTYGIDVILSERGLVTAGDGVAPTGTVTYTANGSTLCAATLPSSSCTTTSPLGTGTYAVTATYSGDSNYVGSTAATSFTIDQAPTEFVASATPEAAVYPSRVLLAATGLPVGSTGSVGFSSGGVLLCSALVSGGTASCHTRALPGGKWSVQASYSGDSNYLSSTATTVFVVDGGYWLAGSDGGVFAFGGARFHGSTEEPGFADDCSRKGRGAGADSRRRRLLARHQ